MKHFDKINSVKGTLEFRGDKSISHRAVIFSALADGESLIKNVSRGADVTSTVECFEKMGVSFLKSVDGLRVKGAGFGKFAEPSVPLFCGNSGTTARLLSGILACQKFKSSITGDSSLSTRPMKRIIVPLREMGGIINARENNFLPVEFSESYKLFHFEYLLTIPSAQVKSALILAAIHLEGKSKIIEDITTRNHTELMLDLRTQDSEGKKIIHASKENYPTPCEYFIPGDISTAAFFIVLTLLANNSELLIKNISLNPTRTAFIDVLKRMGGDIEVISTGISNRELYGTLLIRSSKLSNIEIEKEIISLIIDEIPILAVAGFFAEGDFVIKGAKELRVKESDRIRTLCENLKNAGVKTEEFEEGFSLKGMNIAKTGSFKSYNDHRIAMAMTILSLLLENGGKIDNFEYVKISNPEFIDQLEKVCR